MLNKVMLIGRLGKDPEMRFLPDGTPYAQLSLATERNWRNEAGEKRSETDWHNVVAWNKLASVCGKYLSKGQLVYVEGRLQTRSWDDDGVKRYRTEVVAEQVKFLERKTEESTTPQEDLPV
jgi:single-strand DNA-binding protein